MIDDSGQNRSANNNGAGDGRAPNNERPAGGQVSLRTRTKWIRLRLKRKCDSGGGGGKLRYPSAAAAATTISEGGFIGPARFEPSAAETAKRQREIPFPRARRSRDERKENKLTR